MTWWTDLLGWIHPGPIPPAPTPTPGPAPTAYVSLELLRLVNAARTAGALFSLSLDARLVTAAQQHAMTMARAGILVHEGIGDGYAWARASAAGYPCLVIDENIAEGYPNAEAVVNAWLSDPAHRANVLGPCVNFGGAVATDARGRLWWSATFAEPK